ncbi:MAG TPA: RNA polymerase sigma-70 factor [Mycobacteriales bacterium]|nr:RNA polymerase sigma-70 factor [Mycobacteriales bacterium]
MTESTSAVDEFEAARPRLLGIAYRMLGMLADAEDVVQDVWLRWCRADRTSIESVDAWLTTVTTRVAVDRLRKATRRREEYVGVWLPEPLCVDADPALAVELADSLTLGFLTVLDQLEPVERAVFLLAEVFRAPYREIAEAVGKSEAACRQIASRARTKVRRAPARRPLDHERRLIDEMLAALASGDVAALLAHLAPDVVCTTDGGPSVSAARHPIVGQDHVARFALGLAQRFGSEMEFQHCVINGGPGLIGYERGVVRLAMVFEFAGDSVAQMWIVRNPDKLLRIPSGVQLR